MPHHYPLPHAEEVGVGFAAIAVEAATASPSMAYRPNGGEAARAGRRSALASFRVRRDPP